MALKIERKQVDFDACFQEDMDQYYDIANQFLNLNSEDYGTAFEISKKSWVLSDRWSAIAANASKLAAVQKVSKTDLYNYCYQKYRQLQYMHEFSRILWNKGEQASKEKRIGG
jgi:hypothetical protein